MDGLTPNDRQNNIIAAGIADAIGVVFNINGERISLYPPYFIGGRPFIIADGKLIYRTLRGAEFNGDFRYITWSCDLGDPNLLDNLREFLRVFDNPGD
jgi:hypothetical protein